MILRNNTTKTDNPELAPLSPWSAGHDYDPDLHGDLEAPGAGRWMGFSIIVAAVFIPFIAWAVWS